MNVVPHPIEPKVSPPPPKVAKPLTPSQRKVFDFIVSYLAEHGYPPGLRDISGNFGWTSTNAVADHLRRLETKGFIQVSSTLSRGIKVLKMPADYPPVFDAKALVVRVRTAIADVAALDVEDVAEADRAALLAELVATRARINDLVRWLGGPR